MDHVLQTILRFDEAGDYQAILDYLAQAERDTDELVYIVYQLIARSRIQSAYLLARAVAGAGVMNPLVTLMLAVGSLLIGDVAEEGRQTAVLGSLVDRLTADQQTMFYREIVRPVLLYAVERAIACDDESMLVRCLEIMKSATPLLRPTFDFSAKVPAIDHEVLVRQGRQRARLITYADPPAGIRVERRVVIAVRRLFFPNKVDSRLCDIGPRLLKSMRDYGWRATFYGMECADLSKDYRSIADLCEREQADVLLLDDHMIEAPASHLPRAAMIAELRQKLPSLKLVALHFDAWALDPAVLINTASVDLLWTIWPSLPVWQHSVFSNKLFEAPLPHGGYQSRPVAPLSPRITFTGGIKGYNWHRAFWRMVTARYGLPIDWHLSNHLDDNLSAIDSYMDYMQRLTDTAYSLNLSMRPDLSCITTGRTFETILCGALLVQEATPDLDYFFISGEHYLSFSSFAELKAICEFIKSDPAAAEAIRRTGSDFALAHYSDHKIIGYLERKLFYSGLSDAATTR